MCGLSSNQPFCDGSHNKTADEEAGKVYRYNPDGTNWSPIKITHASFTVLERNRRYKSSILIMKKYAGDCLISQVLHLNVLENII
jgi:hypothetical protein